jgi:Domain of unknown function (DUF4386)
MQKTNKWERSSTSILTGILFIAAALTSMIGLALYNPILTENEFLINGAEHRNQIMLGVVFELLLICSAIGTAILLFPILGRYNNKAALGYFTFRLLEVIVILIGTISVLGMLSNSSLYQESLNLDPGYFKVIGLILKEIHDWTFIIGPNFMLGINTFIYAFAFNRYKIIPKRLAILGMVGAILIFLASLLELFGVIEQISVAGVLLAIPIFLYEMSLAVWLIKVGLKQSDS